MAFVDFGLDLLHPFFRRRNLVFQRLERGAGVGGGLAGAFAVFGGLAVVDAAVAGRAGLVVGGGAAVALGVAAFREQLATIIGHVAFEPLHLAVADDPQPVSG